MWLKLGGRLLKRNGKIYTVAIPNTQSTTLLPIIQELVKPSSIVYMDTYRSYDVLDTSKFSYFRLFGAKQNAIYANLIVSPLNFI
ncbi:Transposase and inactivated derivatives [Avibacterium volantium]|uniref:Transposase and inactivated derivatives n=1 Tax=Avibacterium volantium TaxID=762 RepID=A0A3S5DJ83_AVIVO|nr:Transposase and inactivated derivatives [Avibacterium volantium]